MSGYVEILPCLDAEGAFVVMEWSQHGDSGWCAGEFPNREAAVSFANSHAAANGQSLHRAEVVKFQPQGAA